MEDKKIDIEFKSFIISFLYLIIFIFVITPLGIYGYLSFISLSIITIIVNIILKRKEDKNYIDSINDKNEYDYWRDISFKYITPVDAGKLLGVEKIGINTFVTILFELRKKQIFNIEHKNSKFYISLKNTNLDEINKLPYYEKNIVKLLFTGTDDKSKIELNEIISMIKNDSEKKVFLDNIYEHIESDIRIKYYTSYLKYISRDSKNNNLGLLIVVNNLIMNAFIGIIYTLTLLSAFSLDTIPIIVSTIVVTLLQVILTVNINRSGYIRKEYIDEVRKLNGLYNFINDFSNIKEKELKYYELYQEYFLYAISMGIADKFEVDLGYDDIMNDMKANVEFLFACKKEYI